MQYPSLYKSLNHTYRNSPQFQNDVSFLKFNGKWNEFSDFLIDNCRNENGVFDEKLVSIFKKYSQFIFPVTVPIVGVVTLSQGFNSDTLNSQVKYFKGFDGFSINSNLEVSYENLYSLLIEDSKFY